MTGVPDAHRSSRDAFRYGSSDGGRGSRHPAYARHPACTVSSSPTSHTHPRPYLGERLRADAGDIQQLVDAAFQKVDQRIPPQQTAKKLESPASPTNPASCNGTAHGAEYNTAAARTAATGLQAEESPDFENRPAWPWKPERKSPPGWACGSRHLPPRGGRGGKAASPPTTPGTAGRSDAAGTGSAPAKGVCPPLRQSTPGPTQAPR